ncbi:hypothetical protein SDC9_199431 [bioreactor metagenome]|uniref:Uncharacterized protein n=1 Tax=bioreactor metagenome TaxID=1076179 RepID=A0A645ILR5_9ZZZZ
MRERVHARRRRYRRRNAEREHRVDDRHGRHNVAAHRDTLELMLHVPEHGVDRNLSACAGRRGDLYRRQTRLFEQVAAEVIAYRPVVVNQYGHQF